MKPSGKVQIFRKRMLESVLVIYCQCYWSLVQNFETFVFDDFFILNCFENVYFDLVTNTFTFITGKIFKLTTPCLCLQMCDWSDLADAHIDVSICFAHMLIWVFMLHLFFFFFFFFLAVADPILMYIKSGEKWCMQNHRCVYKPSKSCYFCTSKLVLS